MPLLTSQEHSLGRKWPGCPRGTPLPPCPKKYAVSGVLRLESTVMPPTVWQTVVKERTLKIKQRRAHSGHGAMRQRFRDPREACDSSPALNKHGMQHVIMRYRFLFQPCRRKRDNWYKAWYFAERKIQIMPGTSNFVFSPCVKRQQNVFSARTFKKPLLKQ